MAYRIGTIHQGSQELGTRKAIGVAMPFNSDSVFVSTYNSLEAYKVNLYNFFMTEKRERFFNPELGSGLLPYLFNESPDQELVKGLEGTIRFEIEQFFPRLEIIQIQIEEFPEENALQISIQFRLRGTELEDNLILDISK